MAIKEIDALGKTKGALEGHKPTVMLCVFSYGGLKGQTSWSLIQEMRYFDRCGVNFIYHAVDDDALISRSRSKVLSAFLANPTLDVCFMLDHDIEFEQGALLSAAVKAKMVQSCVAGIYSARAFGRGMSSRPRDERVTLSALTDTLVEADYLGAGFLAIPRTVVDEVYKAGIKARERLEKPTEVDISDLPDLPTLANQALHPSLYAGKAPSYDFFRPICVPRSIERAKIRPDLPSIEEVPFEYLSEDWAFSWRCRQANPNRPLYLWAMPWLKHWGDHGFTMDTAFVTKDEEVDEKKVIAP